VSLAIVPFRNASGDHSIDWLGASLGEMLGADVGQSSAVRTVSSSRLQQILQDLAVPSDATFDPTTLRRLSEFSNAETLVWGQYVKVGERIRIDATLQDFKQGRSVPLKSEVTTEEDMLAAVDRLARSIRWAVTSSPDVLRELGATAFKPSSSSVPAIRAYNEGVQLARRGNHQNAVKSLAAAVQADPAFALAHSQLALSHATLGQDDRAEDSSRRAMQLSTDLPARERYLIEATHARIMNDNPKAIQAYEQLVRVSPDDPDVQFALAGLREGVGSLEEARKGYENVLVRDPKHVEALLSVGRVHIKQGNPQASLDFLNRALALSIELADTEEKGRILHAIGVAYKRLNKPEDALRYYQEALQIRRSIGQKNGIASSLTEVADVQKTLGRPAEALASYKEALGFQREIGDRRGTGTTALSLGAFLLDRGAYDEALKLFRESLQVNREAGDEGGQALSLNNIGAAYFSMGKYEDALTYFGQALQLREKLKVGSDIAETVHNLGEASARIGRFDEAVSRYLRALELYRAAGDKLNVAIESDALGTVFGSQGRYGASVNVKTEAVKSVRESGESGYWMASVLGGYGQALILVGRAGEADQPLSEASAIARTLGNRALLAQIGVHQADRLFYTGDYKAAARLYREASQAAAGLGDQRLRLVARLGEARSTLEGGRPAMAVATLEALTAQAAEMGLRDLSAECALSLGQALAGVKNRTDARRHVEDALSRAERLGMLGLLARSHYVLSMVEKDRGDDAEAARHLAEARRIVADLSKEAKSGTLASRADLAPINEGS
jgi:tetratricopeptide (TPR) repeat protein